MFQKVSEMTDMILLPPQPTCGEWESTLEDLLEEKYVFHS